MQRRVRAAFIVSAATMAAACNDRSSSPTAPATFPLRANPVGTLALTCNTATLETLANAYAASPNDPLYASIAGLFSVQFHGPNAAATDIAFDGLARLAAMRGTSAQKAAATGATFDGLAKGFLGCMESYITSTIPTTFSVAGALGPGWLFEVRGDNGQDGATVGAYTRGNVPFWAAEPQAGRTWGNSLIVTAPSGTTATNRVLLYGYQFTDYTTLDPRVGNAFELATVPTVASGVLDLVPSLHIGLCEIELDETLRVQHVVTVLPNAPLACDTPPAFAGGASALARLNPLVLAKKAVNYFVPQTLHAALLLGSVGGAVSELSPSAVINMQGVALDFGLTVRDGTKSVALQNRDGGPLAVSLKTINGSPLWKGTVTLTIDGNQGKNALFKDGEAAPSETVTRTTDENGVATFNDVFLTKAGGYRLRATGVFDGVEGTAVISNLFNVKNK